MSGESAARARWRYLVSALGALLAAVGIGTVLLDGRLTGTELLQVSSLVVLCGLLVVAGGRIAVDIDDPADAVRVLAWMSAGVLALGVLGAWARVVVPTVGTAFQTALLFLSVLAAGALFGAVVGDYDVRSRRLVERASREAARREFIDDQRAALSTLNDILRHQILNDLNAISGRAELLDDGKIDRDVAVDSIVAHCEHMDETVDRLETVLDALTWVTASEPRPVGTAIDRAVGTLHERHPDVAVTVEGDTDAAVTADELLSLAIAEVLDNAVVHGTPPVTVSVDARGDSVVVAVADTGGNVPLRSDTLFEPNTRGPDSDGDGLGLFLADLILDRYGGAVRLAGDAGTTFEIVVPSGDGEADVA